MADDRASFSTYSDVINTSARSLNLSALWVEEGLSPAGYIILGIMFASVSCIGLVANGVGLLVFAKNKTLRSPTNFFIMTLCVCDLLMALASSVACSASFNYGWPYGQGVCLFEGFTMYALGLTSMYLLAAISVDRYIVIVKPHLASRITEPIACAVILTCWLAGLLWAGLPLVGWNRYMVEGVGISCSIDWTSSDQVSSSYVITIFVFCLLVPLFLMVFSYLNICMVIRQNIKNSVLDANSRITKKNKKIERKLVKTCIAMVAAYLISWSPYTVVSFLAAFSDTVISPVVVTLPALIAKCCGLWNPLIYLATNTQFRKAFCELLPRSKVNDIASDVQENITGETMKPDYATESNRKSDSDGNRALLTEATVASGESCEDKISLAEIKPSHVK